MFCDVKVDVILCCVDVERLFIEIRQVQAANRKFGMCFIFWTLQFCKWEKVWCWDQFETFKTKSRDVRIRRSSPALCCNRTLGPCISNRCWAMDRRVCGSRRWGWGRIRYLRQQFVVRHWSSSGRPRVFWLPCRNCCHEPGARFTKNLLNFISFS